MMENSWNGTEYDKYGMYAQGLALACFTLPRSVPMIYGGQGDPFNMPIAFLTRPAWNGPSVLRWIILFFPVRIPQEWVSCW